ncbi:MAG: ABC transporter permease [Polyangiaceae bacterium]|nr:ABC transporter permease [Polyangiaceae bacterium]
MESWMVSNLVVAVLLVGGAWIAVAVSRHDIWRAAVQQVWKRRPGAVLVVCVYVLLALLDSVAWRGNVDTGSDVVAQHEAVTLLERLFGDAQEKSYSAPLADIEFYDHSPLKHPGSHLFGTDILGGDVFLMTLKGARVALLIGGLTSLIAIPLALLFGIPAGYFGKRIDDVVFFIMSTLASIPTLLLLISITVALGRSTLVVCFALAVTSWVGFCRIARGETMKLREMDYVHAARLMGASETTIILRHILPNLMHLVVITFVLMFSGLVLSEAVLAWLGIGVNGSWGLMIAKAKDELSRDPAVWWNVGGAGVGLFGLLLAVNFLGDAVRDALDPRTRKES